MKKITQKEIAEASLIFYLDYIMRDELFAYIKKTGLDKESDTMAEEITQIVLERMFKDFQDVGPKVFSEIGNKVKEAVAHHELQQ